MTDAAPTVSSPVCPRPNSISTSRRPRTRDDVRAGAAQPPALPSPPVEGGAPPTPSRTFRTSSTSTAEPRSCLTQEISSTSPWPYFRRARPSTACAMPRSSSIRRPTPIAASPSRRSRTGCSAPWTGGARTLGLSSRLILCFLRHLDEDAALRHAQDGRGTYLDRIAGVGLDSSEVGHPPSKFARLQAAGERGLRLTAHAGEEGPPAYVHEALDLRLHVARIDHGNRALEDAR